MYIYTEILKIINHLTFHLLDTEKSTSLAATRDDEGEKKVGCRRGKPTAG